MKPLLKDTIVSIIGDITGSRMLPQQGCTSVVQVLETAKGAYLLKSSYKQKYREWLKEEADVLNRLGGSKDINTPVYYGYFEDDDSSHLIMSYEKGANLTEALKIAENPEERHRLIRGFGNLLQQLHETDTDLLSQEENWLEEQLSKAEKYVQLGEADGDMELLETLKSNKPMRVKHTVIHGDCNTDNVLVTDSEVKMFIDVAGMAYGDPRYDESLAIRKFSEEERQSFYEGYKRYKVSEEEFTYFNNGLYEFF
ncbi:aminoglycoside phosphotransferase family protein [Bacillus sp. 1P06AnD]|uniref:aminoglycoside phosphotransferase family protein n=1 Tax=Bacillus sp. 1P06AnD TaxID=3132208 RepID=UPI00399F1C04